MHPEFQRAPAWHRALWPAAQLLGGSALALALLAGLVLWRLSAFWGSGLAAVANQ